MQNAMPPKDMGMATASATFFRQVGGTLGTAVFLSILFSTVNDKIGSAFRAAAGTPGFQAALADPAVRADPANRVVLDAVSGTGGGIGGISLDDTQFLSHLDPRLALPFLQGFAGSMSVTFLFGAAVLAVALALVVFLPEVTLRQQSGIEARRSQDAPPPAVAGAEHAVASAVPVAVAEQAVRPGPRLGTASGPEPNPVTGPGSPRGRRSAVPVGAAHGADAYGADPDRADREPVTGRMSVAVLARPSGAPARSRPDPEAARSHPEPGTGEVRASGSMPAEARDRLLGQLVPDVDGTVASLRAAEQARDDVRRARRELNERTMALIEARRDLVRRGLTPEQVDRVLRLSGAEAARPD
jgi:hypothetical protein